MDATSQMKKFSGSNHPFETAAASYAQKGLSVFPVAPIGQGPKRQDGKEPYPGTRGFRDASSDPEQIAAWAKQYPDANIGLACELSDLVAVDVDLDLDDPEQNARWERYRAANDLPPTFEQRTAGGGLHLVYKASKGAKYPGKLEDGEGKIADIKFNGYILLAPSIAQSGRRDTPGTYELLNDCEPVEAPDWLSNARPKGRTSPPANGPLAQLARDAREFARKETDDKLIQLLQSKRNTIASRDEWLRLGFGLHAGYVGTKWETEALLAFIKFSERWEAPRGTRMADFGENAEEVWRKAVAQKQGGVLPATAHMILKKLPDLPPADVKPVQLPERIQQPAQAQIRLPGLAGRIADVLREASDRDLRVLPEAGALAAMSALAAPRFVLQGPQGKVPLNVYTLLLGGTGSGKEAARDATDMALKAANRRGEFLASAASDKALHRALAEGGATSGRDQGSVGARVLAMDEGGLHLDAIRSGNNGHQKQLLTLMMQLFGRGLGQLPAHKYADHRNEIPSVDCPRLTVMLTSTPGALEKAVGQEDSESGMLNRFLVFEEDGYRELREGNVNRDLLHTPPEDIVKACQRFPARDASHVVATALNRAPSDEVVVMSTSAERIFEDFRTGEVEDWRRRKGQVGESWARAAEYALRVAGLLALSDAAMEGSGPLHDITCEDQHMSLAIEIVRRAVSGVADLATSAGRTSLEALKDKIKEAIAELAGKDGFANARKVKKKVLRGTEKRQRENVLDTMIEDGEITQEFRPTGGRPNEWYAIAEESSDDA
ncbi:bifunctional DNA primase/polymerase [Celeribacter litoreus]|uniref:bifunctional DNA primase/polymerase n=1 Tax=Celeribacter litoreus TaxID=2876714 RepID=UPI001CC9D425|nr:bifunctional DNA primase/polymerase [Celeribacter litoreus]MCA0044107.1 bifunctional DNA primase/polymerase [Celeribacter litoreus]